MRLTTKIMTAAASGLALLAFSAVPASANTVSATVEDGLIEAYGPFAGSPSASIGLGSSGAGSSCSSSNSITATGNASSGTISATISSVSEVIDPAGPGSPDYVSVLTATITGTYSGTAVTITGGSATAVLRPLTAPCTPTSGTPTCTIQADNLVGGGTLTSGTFPTLGSGDTATVSVGNSDFETSVTDSATVCGPFTAVDSGRITAVVDLKV